MTDAAGNVNATNHKADITVTGVNDAPVLDLDTNNAGTGRLISGWNGSAIFIVNESSLLQDVDSDGAITNMTFVIPDGITLGGTNNSYQIQSDGTTFNSNAPNESSYSPPLGVEPTIDNWLSFLQQITVKADNPAATTDIGIKITDNHGETTQATVTLSTLADAAQLPSTASPLPTSAQMDLFSESTVADPVDSPTSSDAGTADALAQAVTELATAAAQALGADSAATLDAALASDIGSVDWNAVLTPEIVDQVDEALSALDQLDLSAFTLDPALSSLLDHWASSADTAAVLTSLAADDALRQLIDQQLSTVALGAVV